MERFKSWENIYAHTQDRSLSPEIKAAIGSVECEICKRRFSEHSGDEFEACLQQWALKK
jgi:hypothetical protein